MTDALASPDAAQTDAAVPDAAVPDVASAVGGSASRGTRVSFELAVVVPMTPERAWQRLADWGTHGDWIPMTRVDVDAEDPSRFVAWSGIGPLTLEDRMRVTHQEFDGTAGRCRVAKLGPVLVGEAEFAVAPGLTAGTAVVQWREEVSVSRLPSVLAPLAAWVGARLFALSLRGLPKGA